MATTQLNLIVEAEAPADTCVIFYQRNLATPGAAIVWWVVDYPPPGGQTILYSSETYLTVTDCQTNNTITQTATPGKRLLVVFLPSGEEVLYPGGKADNPQAIEVRNDLTNRTVNVSLLRDEQIIAAPAELVPGQTADFVMDPLLYVCLGESVPPGSTINPMDYRDTIALNLSGVASVDLVLSDGGALSVQNTQYTQNAASV